MYFQKVYTESDWDNDDDATPVIPLDWRNGTAALRIDVTGTINYDLQQTFDDIQFKEQPFTWSVDDAETQSGATASQTVLYRAHPKAIRLLINSFTSGATVTLSYTQIDE